ncbi:MAG: ABC transporter permease [Clostridia bacterium]|nr:ABC transporter permease [Clostridia bacterium]
MRQESLRRVISIGLLVLLIAVFSLTSSYFLAPKNIFAFLRDASVTGIIAVGVTFVIITAGIDLSTGALAALCSMVMGNFLFYLPAVPVPVVCLVSIAIGILGGLFNGLVVTRLRLPDFIATLASQGIFRGLTMLFAIRERGRIRNQVIKNRAFLAWSGNVSGLFYVTIAFIIMVIIGQLILKKTKIGTYTYATGASRKSADLSGIHTGRIKRFAFGLSGFCCGLASIFLLARTGAATVELGTGLEFDVIAAVVVGGCAFSGGRGDVVGSMIGALFMAILTNGIYKYNLGSEYHVIIKGAVIIVMVLFDAIYQRYFQKRSRSAKQPAAEVKEAAV